MTAMQSITYGYDIILIYNVLILIRNCLEISKTNNMSQSTSTYYDFPIGNFHRESYY